MRVKTIRHIILTFALACLTSNIAMAQINALSDQYLLNPFHINPAVAGTQRYMPLNVNTGQKWLGISKAPSTQSISIHRRIRAKDMRFTPKGFLNRGKNSFGKVGVGGGIFNYSYGAISHTGIHIDYAYHVFLGRGRLAFGLAPVLYQFALNKTGFTMPDGQVYDPLIADASSESLFFLDANAGLHYYDDENYAGLSFIQLLNSSVQFGQLSFNSDDKLNVNGDLATSVYGYYGKKIALNQDLVLEPSGYLKYNLKTGFRVHINALAHFQDMVTAGLSYRLKESVGIILGVRLDNLMLRYIFEAPYSSQVPNRFTSHQIMVNFNLGEPIE